MSLFRTKKRSIKKPQLLTPSKLVEEKGSTPTSSSLIETEKAVKEILGVNGDLQIKHFKIFGQFSAACVYLSSLVNQDVINQDILKPLMYEPEHLMGREKPLNNIINLIITETIYHSQAKVGESVDQLIELMLRGKLSFLLMELRKPFILEHGR